MKRAEEIANTGVLVSGCYTEELENYIEDYLDVNFCCAFASYSTALDSCLQTLLKDHEFNSEIIVPSYCSIDLIHSIIRSGFKPIFIDIDDDYLIDTTEIHSLLSKKTAAIIAPNIYGNLCDSIYIEAYYPHIKIIYDSTQAFGAFYEEQNRYVGNLGDCEIFSLENNITNSIGAFITTNNSRLYDSLCLLRSSGIASNEVIEVGYNNYLPEFSAALALTNIENSQETIERYYDNYMSYKYSLGDVIRFKEKQFFSNYSHITIEHENRKDLITFLETYNIFCQPVFKPTHNSLLYESFCNKALLMTNKKFKTCINLPQDINIDYDVIKYICGSIKEFLHV